MTTSQIISMALAYRKGTRDLQGESKAAERGWVGRTRGPQRLRKTGRIRTDIRALNDDPLARLVLGQGQDI